MKKVFIVLAVSALAYACGGNQNAGADKTPDTAQGSAASSAATTTSDTLSSNPDYKKGLELVAGADCTTCHKIDETNIGPSYRDVANKYESTPANITLLSNKIIKGGQGVWGSVPMTPHPDLSKDDVKQMLKFIFLLRNK